MEREDFPLYNFKQKKNYNIVDTKKKYGGWKMMKRRNSSTEVYEMLTAGIEM